MLICGGNDDNKNDEDRFGRRRAAVGWGWIDSVGVDATDIAKQHAACHRRAMCLSLAVDATDIAKQHAADEGQAMQDAAKFARRVRRRLGFSQAELSRRIDVSIDTVRNWEQGKRCSTGAAKTLLKVLDRGQCASIFSSWSVY